MAFLFIAFPTAMGVGTFLETFYSTTAAKIWIYNARWFEVIMLLLMLNFIGNIFKYKLLRKEKWAVLSLHLSFTLILLGAFTTRYFGFEGVMPIREGDESNKMISEKKISKFERLTDHYRRFIDPKKFEKKLQNLKFKILYKKFGINLSKTSNENPHLCRIVFAKMDKSKI